MNTLTKIACRTIGTVGMGVALYEATQVGKQFSKNYSIKEQSKYLEKAYFNGRTMDSISYSGNDMRNTAFNKRTKNPLPSLWGKIKGGIGGGLYGLADQLPTVICSSFAILGKGVGAKVGAVGVVLFQGFNVLRNVFGLGKHNPMD